MIALDFYGNDNCSLDYLDSLLNVRPEEVSTVLPLL